MVRFMMPFFDLVLSSVDDHESGSASGTVSSIRQFGSALGMQVALWSVVGLTALAFIFTALLPSTAREGVSEH